MLSLTLVSIYIYIADQISKILVAPSFLPSCKGIVHPSYIQSRMEVKRKILQASDILSETLPCLSNLSTIGINLVHGIKDQFGHASGYMLPHQDYYHGPLEKLLTATLLAQQNGVTIRNRRLFPAGIGLKGLIRGQRNTDYLNIANTPFL